jgi:curved DNA-binding protein CbpA
VLGLNDHATLDELKTARKTLVLQYHPDVSTSIDAATKFRAIQDAYEILSDAPTRAKYDAARNIILDKVAASVTSPPIGFITQQLNYGTVRKAASSTWQSLAADRLKSTAWQKLPLVSKKVGNTDMKNFDSLNIL